MRPAAVLACVLALAAIIACSRETAEQPAEPVAQASASAQDASSTYTSIAADACRAPAADVRAVFEDKDLGVQECPGVGAWRVLLVSSQERSWLELRSTGEIWSSEPAIVREAPIGLFPNVNDGERLEWRTRGGAEPHALIFNVTAQDPEQPDRRVSRDFVVRLGGGTPCVIDRAPSRDTAIGVADAARGCDVAR